jgi:beta,beta-carotene 9',10'-dioxygenase
VGIRGVDRELQVEELPHEGELPTWLSGTLIFNGPGTFEAGDEKVEHWFDGLAMLRRFTFTKGKVSYANRFLQTRGYRKVLETGEFGYEQFGTNTRTNLLRRLSLLFSSNQFPDNANINLMKYGKRYLALTETPTTIEFDPETLETIGEHDFGGRVPATVTTAHPQHDLDQKITYNITQKFSLGSSYNIYSLQHSGNRRELLTSIPVSRPGYMHSFGMTENYIILTEVPFTVNPIRFLVNRLPFIQNYEWRSDQAARFIVFRKSDGGIVDRFEADAFFYFHHINAFERAGELFIDLAAYPDPSIIDELYLDRMTQPNRRHIPILEVRRYMLSTSPSKVDYEVILDEAFELPGINYANKNGIEYRFAYGLGLRRSNPFDFLNQLIKLDVEKGDTKIWHEDDCYPGEPVFVPAPEAIEEDDGLILSVVLDTEMERSFLLILDARSFNQIAKAEVPHALPFGFHGQFFGKGL